MRRVVHVISDLHLGGTPASATRQSFQMCPPETHAALARLIDRLPPSTTDLASTLVVAGDIVDFLAEEPFSTFTVDPVVAREKLQRIFDSTKVVWDALNRYAGERHGHLILMLGNHDIELSLPGVRPMLLSRVGGARTEFIYDNEAYSIGPLLIEHGNRFDAWNAVPHGALRRVRSQLSRKVPVSPPFLALPGSRMVIDVINQLKPQYPFIDLLKPETAVALPIAAALGALGLKDTWKAYANFRESCSVDYDETSSEPVDQNYISGEIDPDQVLWDAAQDIEAGGDSQQVSGLGDVLRKSASAAAGAMSTARIDALFMAFRKLANLRRMHRDAFSVEHESPTYLNPARRSAAAGYKVIIYGHTHLPKRIALGDAGDPDSAFYLNTGTWADVMCLPAGIWDEAEPEGKILFRQFCADLDGASLARWRRTLPTYARVELEDDALMSADILFGDDDTRVTTDGVWKRLASEHAHD